MIGIEQIEYLVRNTPTDKLKIILNFLKRNNFSKFSALQIQKECKLTSEQTDLLCKICQSTLDGNSLSIAIQAIMKLEEYTSKKNSKLVMTGDFIQSNVDFTHEKIYQMIAEAKFEIIIVGYWVYKMGDFFTRLKELSKQMRIIFILNDEKFKEFIQEMKDDIGSLVNFEIYKINRESFPEDKLGKLHSKIIIVDANQLLVTSANLTIVAMEKNIETGIWSNDEHIAKTCREIFMNWIEKKMFIKLTERRKM